MQWDGSENAGFTTGTPWIGVNPNYTTVNVKAALEDSDSIFYTYQKLIRLRKELPVVTYGSYELLLPDHEAIYAFTRTLGTERLLVILNFTGGEPVLELPETVTFASHELLVANYPVAPGEEIRRFVTRPYEARVYRLH